MVFALCGILCQPGAAADSSAGTDPRCGGHCLFVGLAALERAPASYADFEKAIGEPGVEGYSIHQLEEYARSRGLQTIAVKTSLDHLGDRAERFFCIALLEKGHFVILQDADRSGARIIDPPRSYTLPADSFRALWTGHALLVGPSAFVTEEELGRSRAIRKVVVVSASLFGIGAIVILVGNSCLRRFRARRSSVALLILLAALGAGCGSGQVEHADPLGFKAPDQSASWRSTVRVTTDDEGAREVTIPVSMLVVKRECGEGGP